MNIAQLHRKDVIQARTGANLGRVDDVEFAPESARVEGLVMRGRPRLFGLLGRDADVIIPWQEVVQLGEDVLLVSSEPPTEPAGTGPLGRLFRR